jgi:hypothetical protein
MESAAGESSFGKSESAKHHLNGAVPHSASRIYIIKSIKIQDASVSFIDQNQGLLLDIWLTDINASLNDFSLTKPFRLTFDASLYSDSPNIHGSVLVSLPSPPVGNDLSKQSVRFKDLSLHMDLSQINIDELKGISPQMPRSPDFKKITGAVQLNMPYQDNGVSGDIEANGDLIITDGAIKNFNVINTVLSHILGVVMGMDSIKDKLGGIDTVIEKAVVKFSFRNNAFSIEDSLIKTNIFDFTAKGTVDKGLYTDLQTMLHLNIDVSTALVNEFEGLKFLCDDSKRISIDASLKGVIPHLKYKPNKDFRKRSKKALIEEGGNILGVLLGGASSSEGQGPPSKDTVKKQKKSIKNIFRNLLK